MRRSSYRSRAIPTALLVVALAGLTPGAAAPVWGQEIAGEITESEARARARVRELRQMLAEARERGELDTSGGVVFARRTGDRVRVLGTYRRGTVNLASYAAGGEEWLARSERGAWTLAEPGRFSIPYEFEQGHVYAFEYVAPEPLDLQQADDRPGRPALQGLPPEPGLLPEERDVRRFDWDTFGDAAAAALLFGSLGGGAAAYWFLDEGMGMSAGDDNPDFAVGVSVGAVLGWIGLSFVYAGGDLSVTESEPLPANIAENERRLDAWNSEREAIEAANAARRAEWRQTAAHRNRDARIEVYDLTTGTVDTVWLTRFARPDTR